MMHPEIKYRKKGLRGRNKRWGPLRLHNIYEIATIFAFYENENENAENVFFFFFFFFFCI